LDRYLVAGAARQLRQERVAAWPAVDDGRIPEADVYRRRPRYSLEGAVQCRETKRACLFRPRLHVRLIDLHNIRAGGAQVADFRIDRSRVVQRGALAAAVVEIDLRLLRHREGPWDGDLHLAIRVTLEKLQVREPDRLTAADRTDDSRHGIRVS